MSTTAKKVRDLICDARNMIASRDHAPSIANALISTMWDAVKSDDDILRHLVSRGLNQEIRSFLSRFYNNGEAAKEIRSYQLAMWADERAKRCVEQIDRERIWVPSRGDFVELIPDALSVEEMREAGEYLIQHGADCVRRGRLILRLADLTVPA